ncbi:MAG: transporter [Desulfovibrionaceae bacterium]|nr:transporter [Desulfovibrionaceae bacterium]
MQKRFLFTLALVFLLASACPVFAQSDSTGGGAEPNTPKQESTRSKMLFAAPVNVNIAGAGSLPKGRLVAMLNASFADRTRAKRGSTGPDVFAQTWLLKLRYGITNNLELAIITPYINLERSPKPHNGPTHLEGFGDQSVGLTFAPWNEFLGDPLTFSMNAGFLLPTGNHGKNHLPGNGVWGARLQAAVRKMVTKDICLDTEFVYMTPFDRGNQKVKRGDQYLWNVNARYLFDRFDIGLESSLIMHESGNRSTPAGNVNLRNGIKEWYIGPSMNVGLDALGMWAGIGAFFPVMQDVRGPAKVEDVRYEFKIGKVW